jgi:hypothetical protein
MVVPEKENALSVETPSVSPSLKRKPLKDLVVLEMLIVALTPTGKAVVPPGVRETPFRDTEKPPADKVPVLALIKCDDWTAVFPAVHPPAPDGKASAEVQRATKVRMEAIIEEVIVFRFPFSVFRFPFSERRFFVASRTIFNKKVSIILGLCCLSFSPLGPTEGRFINVSMIVIKLLDK